MSWLLSCYFIRSGFLSSVDVLKRQKFLSAMLILCGGWERHCYLNCFRRFILTLAVLGLGIIMGKYLFLCIKAREFLQVSKCCALTECI